MTDEVPRHRILAIALAFVAAIALVVASFSQGWLANSTQDGEITIGLRTTTECGIGLTLTESGQCRTRSNADYASSWDDHTGRFYSAAFGPTGTIALVACLVAALGLLGAAALGLATKKPNLPISPSTIALLGVMVALITGCVFVATKPGTPGSVGSGIMFWIFGAGCVLGIPASILLAKVNRPHDPDLMDDAMDPDNF
ncbi:MAG: hypothetical protein ABI678_21490 [Kofleriaceae bacterium]